MKFPPSLARFLRGALWFTPAMVLLAAPPVRGEDSVLPPSPPPVETPAQKIQKAPQFLAPKKPTASRESPRKVFSLRDGTKILGRLKKFEDGQYHIQTEMLGLIQLAEEKVVKIASEELVESPPPPSTLLEARPKPGSTAGNAPPRPVKSRGNAGSFEGNQPFNQNDIKGFTNKVFSDAGLMQKVMNLQNNPKMQGILANPEIMNAISSGEYGNLMNNPDLQNLMQDPDVQEVIQAIQSSH